MMSRVGWLAAALILILVGCSEGVIREAVGPIQVALAPDVAPIPAGRQILHVQILTADGTRTRGDAMVTASLSDEEGNQPLMTMPVATPGAYEVALDVPEEGQVELTVTVSDGKRSLAVLRYRIEAGSNPKQLSSAVPGMGGG